MELIAPVRVVVIDDRQDHLFAISNALAVVGIPCVSHLYDKESNKLLPTPPLEGYRNIRLIITDLNIRNFTGGNVEAKNLGGILLSDVLLPIIPKNPVPYSLVLWSSVSDIISDVCSYINERIDHVSAAENRRTRPLSIGLMNKGDFISNLTTEKIDPLTLMTEASKGAPQIRAQLEKALIDPQFRLVCAWETRAIEAATSTINAVHSAACVHAEKSEGILPTTALKEVLAKLANEAAGRENAKENPASALDDGLIDLFVDDLRSSTDNEEYVSLINTSLGDVLGKRINLSQPVRYQLNTSLHVEELGITHGKNFSRGLVLGSDDENKIAVRFAMSAARKVLWSEFLFTITQFENAAKDAESVISLECKAQFENAAKDAESVISLECKAQFAALDRAKATLERAKADLASVEAESCIRLIEIGADCDHANKKERTVRLLCALEIPERFAYFLHPPGKDRGYKSESLMKFGPWNLLGKDGIILMVSVRRFATEQKWKLPDDLTPKYRLRRPIVDVVLREYANHSSRLGYVAMTE